MYQLRGPRLRVLRSIASESEKYLRQCRIILYQHLFEDTAEFIENLLAAGAVIDKVIGKEYTAKKQVVNRLRELGLQVIPIKYSEADTGDLLFKLLLSSLQQAKQKGQLVIINEVGGYFASVLSRIPEHLKPYFGGIVEVTTYGYNRYEQIKDQLKYPVFSVARSSLKEIEAIYVGQAVTLAFDYLMRSLGISISGREALVIGYGMIGTEVAKALRSSQIHVTVWDKDPIRRLRAFVDGYHTMDGIGSMKKFDVVISATGTQAVNINMMREMKSGVLLISAGSRNTEFDLEGLQSVADKKEIIHPEIIIYTLGNKEIVVLRDGTALNFQIDSVPTEVTDLLFSEILACMIRLVQKRGELEGGLYELDHLGMASIARRWLKQIQGF